MKCVYCGCTVDNACLVLVDEQPPAVRDRIRRYYRSARREVPAQTGCSWISTEPPICSAPACVEAFAVDKSMAAQV